MFPVTNFLSPFKATLLVLHLINLEAIINTDFAWLRYPKLQKYINLE